MGIYLHTVDRDFSRSRNKKLFFARKTSGPLNRDKSKVIILCAASQTIKKRYLKLLPQSKKILEKPRCTRNVIAPYIYTKNGSTFSRFLSKPQKKKRKNRGRPEDRLTFFLVFFFPRCRRAAFLAAHLLRSADSPFASSQTAVNGFALFLRTTRTADLVFLGGAPAAGAGLVVDAATIAAGCLSSESCGGPRRSPRGWRPVRESFAQVWDFVRRERFSFFFFFSACKTQLSESRFGTWPSSRSRFLDSERSALRVLIDTPNPVVAERRPAVIYARDTRG